MRRTRRARILWLAGVCLALAASALAAGCSGGGDAPGLVGHTDTPTPTATAAPGTPGVFADRVLFGQSAAFNGPARELGKNMRIGIEAAFYEANLGGGVHGRVLELLSLDDSYEPEAAIANTRQLIEEDGVFALIGAVGTPTSRSATPIAAAAGVPYIAPFTGAAFLRDPEWNNIINLRASYNQETEEMVARLIGDLGIERIGIMYQDDSYGRAGYRGSLAALERRGLEPVAVGVYPRNTTAVKTALLDLREGSPEAVIMIGAYEPMAALIKWGRATGFNPVFLNVSFVGSNALAGELGADGAGVIVTQVVPFPDDDSLPVIAAYKRALALYSPDAVPGFVSLEGYLAGRLAIAGLESCGPALNRPCFVDAILGADSLDLEGFGLSFGADDNQGSDAVFITVIGPDGRYHPLETLRDVESWSLN